MGRALSGKLKDLGTDALLKLIASIGASGTLELIAPELSARICFVPDGICAGTKEEMVQIARLLEVSSGTYIFHQEEIPPDPSRVIIDSSEFLSASRALRPSRKAAFASEIDVESLLSGQVMEIAERIAHPEIHVLSDSEPVENPMDDFLAELEETAPDELMMVHLGVVTVDPRPWRRGLQREWKRRAWKLRFFGDPLDVPEDHFDLVIIHHQLSITRIGSHDDWIRLIERLKSRGIALLWIGPLGDPMWVARLVDAGADFLLPPPQGDGGKSWDRFGETLSRVVERLLHSPGRGMGQGDSSGSIVELVDSLLHGADTREALASFLQLASGGLHRGAVFRVDSTLLRCRAGFGYPLLEGGKSLPRGLGLFERVVRTGDSYSGIDGKSAAALQLAQALGLKRLPDQTVLIPLLRRDGVAGIFVGDREGDSLPDLKDLKLLASRLGGVFL